MSAQPHRRARQPIVSVAMAALLLASFAALAAVSSAAPTTAARWSTDAQLHDWVDHGLVPYLTDVFSQHPRFRHQTLRFVSVRGNATSVAMDELTRSMVRRARPVLQKTPGIRLWLPPDAGGGENCAANASPDYDIAIEVLALNAGRHRVVVRALDVAEREWVPGFGIDWQGELTRRERSALALRVIGDDEPGQRSNPYTESQADLLAGALAREIQTRLCGAPGTPVAVYLNVSQDAPPIAARVAGLLRHNLSGGRDVVVTDDRTTADLQFDLHLVAIDGDLHQVWLSALTAQDGATWPGISAQAYLRVAQPAATARAAATVPASIALEEDVAGQAAPAAAATLVSLQAIVPADVRNCASANPWRFGEPFNLPARGVDVDGCFALEMTARDDLIVFLLSVDRDRRVQRLLPSTCPRFGCARSVLVRGETLRFPVAKNARRLAFRAPGRAGTKRFIAVAASDHAAAQRIEAEVAGWDDACTAAGRPSDAATQRTAQRLARLEDTVAKLAGRAELTQLDIQYVAGQTTVATRNADGSMHNE